MTEQAFYTKAAETKAVVGKNKGKALPKNSKSYKAEVGNKTIELSSENVTNNIMSGMKTAVSQLNVLRTGNSQRRAVDISFEKFVGDFFGFESLDSFYQQIGVNPGVASLGGLMSMPEFEEGYRWLVPEIIREAVRLGLRKSPIYSKLIAGEETVAQPQVTMPFVNMSDAMPTLINEGETIPTGSVSFGSKQVKLYPVATGLKITDEVKQYVAINVLALYLQDVGVKLNTALDALAVQTLVNGDQKDGSESAPVIGVNTVGEFKYRDLLKAWLRMGAIGRTPSGILSNEGPAEEILLLDEFKGFNGQSKLATLNVDVPIPQNQNYWINGVMPSQDQILLVDTSAALIKLNASALKVESERIAERRIDGTYVNITTGFSSMFRDARLILDKSLAFNAQGFPAYMDLAKLQREQFKS